MVSYSYSKSVDFNNELNANLLSLTIKNEVGITPILNSVNTSGDDVFISFLSSLTVSEKTILDNLVIAYSFVDEPSNFTYDRQYMCADATFSTTSSSFVDVDLMTLTTKDLTESCAYTVMFNAEISMRSSNQECEFRIIANNVQGVDRTMRFSQPPRTNGATDYNSFTIMCVIPDIHKDTVINVQCRCLTSNSTIYVNRRKFVIDGVRTSEII